MTIKKRSVAELLLVIVAAIYSISFWYVVGCRVYGSLGFDDQALLTWDFTASLGLKPYVDIFYPYSALYFFRNSNIYLNVSYFLVAGFVFLAVFFALKKLWKQSYFSYLSFGIFWIVVSLYLNYDSLARYGLLLASCIFLPIVESLDLKRKYLRWFLFGLMPGVIFSFAFDQGVLCVTLVVMYLLIRHLRIDVFVSSNYNSLLKAMLLFIAGFSLGVLPVLFFLHLTHSLPNIFNYFSELQAISLFAKIPYTHSLHTPVNLFSLVILLLSISALAFRFAFKKVSFNFSLQLQICLTLAIILLEQKNIVRSIEYQLMIFSLLLSFTLFSQWKDIFDVYIKSRAAYYIYFLLWCLLVLSLLGKPQQHPRFNPVLTHSSVGSFCVQENLLRHEKKLEKYREVLKSIKSLSPKKKTPIYSFPGDPIFYVLNDQYPPYYFSTYEASSRFGSEKRIEYLQKQNIQFVIVNLSLPAIADEVPEYVRSAKELRYIFTHYSPVSRVGQFLILQKAKTNVDVFSSSFAKEAPGFLNSLLDVRLENVPRSEGKYKQSDLTSLPVILQSAPLKEVNSYLQNNDVSSRDRVLLVRSSMLLATDTKVTLIVQTDKEAETKVSFNPCREYSCVIRFDNIPFFYTPKRITGIRINDPFVDVGLLQDNKDTFF